MIRPFAMRVVLCVLLLACIPAAAQTLPADKIEKIEKEISAVMSQQNIPGLSVAVVTDHKLRGSHGYGLADVENNVPAKTGTVYRLGSISKTITAIAVMQLAEQGKLNLDAPI
ncbi:MAG TPA: serine hydrolase domain-containing protein, partial [Blastocatellia bacterium]